jgi:hypothetical protein
MHIPTISMTVIYYMRGVVVASEQDARAPWTVEERQAHYEHLPPGFLPKPQEEKQNKTRLKRSQKVDTSALKRAKRNHRSPKNTPHEE